MSSDHQQQILSPTLSELLPPREKNPFASSHWRKRANANRKVISLAAPTLTALGVSVATEVKLLQYLFPHQLACVASRDAVCLIDPFSGEDKPKIIRSFSGGSSDIVGVVPCVGKSLLVARSGGVERLRAATLLPYYTSDDYYYNSSSSSSSSSDDGEESPATTETETDDISTSNMTIKNDSLTSVVARRRAHQEKRKERRRNEKAKYLLHSHSHHQPPSASPATTSGTPSVIGGHLLCISSDPWIGQTIACGCADGSILSWSIVSGNHHHIQNNQQQQRNREKKGGRKKFSIETGIGDDDDEDVSRPQAPPGNVTRSANPNNNNSNDNNNNVSDTISYVVHRDWVTSCDFVKTELGMLILVSISDDGTVCTSDPFTGIVLSTIHGPDLYPHYSRQRNNNNNNNTNNNNNNTNSNTNNTATTTATTAAAGRNVVAARNRAVALSVLGQEVAVAWEDQRGRILRIGIDGKFILGDEYDFRPSSFFRTPAVPSKIVLTNDYIIAGCEDEALSILKRRSDSSSKSDDNNGDDNAEKDEIIAKCSSHHKSRLCCGSFLSTISGICVVNAPTNNNSNNNNNNNNNKIIKEDTSIITWSISDDGELVQWIVPPPSSMTSTKPSDLMRMKKEEEEEGRNTDERGTDDNRSCDDEKHQSLTANTAVNNQEHHQTGYRAYLQNLIPSSLNFFSDKINKQEGEKKLSSSSAVSNILPAANYTRFGGDQNQQQQQTMLSFEEQMKERQNGVSKKIVLPIGELVSICPVKY